MLRCVFSSLSFAIFVTLLHGGVILFRSINFFCYKLYLGHHDHPLPSFIVGDVGFVRVFFLVLLCLLCACVPVRVVFHCIPDLLGFLDYIYFSLFGYRFLYLSSGIKISWYKCLVLS